MRIFQLISDTSKYAGQYTTGIIFCPGGSDIDTCFEWFETQAQLLEHYQNNGTLEKVQEHQKYVDEELDAVRKRPYMYFGPGNHQVIEIFFLKKLTNLHSYSCIPQ